MSKSLVNEYIKAIFDKIRIINTNDTLTVDGFNYEDDECLYINRYYKSLYCLELLGAGNTPIYLSNQIIDNIFDNFSAVEDGQITIAFLKQGLFQRIYIFASNKDLLRPIQRYLDAKFVKSIDMLNVLFDIFLSNIYTIENKKLSRRVEIDEQIRYETLTESFNKIIKDEIYKNYTNIDVYQGYKYQDRKNNANISKLFQVNFDGIVWIYIDIFKENVNALLTNRIYLAKVNGNDKEFVNLKERYNANDIQLALINSVIFMKSGSETEVSEIGNALGIGYKEKPIFKKDMLKFTLLKKRDIYWDALIDKDFMYGLIATVHKEDVDNPNFYGIDVNGAFWNINLSQTTRTKRNKNSDVLILGVKGSGKTTFTNGFIAQMLGFSLKTKEAKEIDKHYIRDFDIKDSGKILAKLLHESYPEKVGFLEATLNNYRYNPLNISHRKAGNRIIIDQNELAMNTLLLSIALESKTKDSTATFNAGEQALFAKIVTELYNKQEFEGDYIETLKQTNPEIYKELIELGYKPTNRTTDIKEDKYSFLRVPKLNNVIKRLEILKHKTTNKKRQHDAENLYAKLVDIDNMQIFSDYDRFDVQSVNYLHLDFDGIKDMPEYIPIFLSIFNRIYSLDKRKQKEREEKGEERPYITYKFEEAYNVFAQPSFEEYIKKFINEARSYRIKAIFTTQLISHIPEYIFNQIENKFLLFPAKNKRDALIDEIIKATHPDQDTIELFRRTEEFSVAIWNEHGTSVIKLAMTDEEVKIYGQSQ